MTSTSAADAASSAPSGTPAISGRKAEIIEVAKTVFAERGVREATVREIGARAGILSGSLYHHFGSKLDIVDAILSDFCTEVLEHYRSMSALEVDPLARLRTMTDYAFSLIPRHSAPLVMILNDSRELIGHPRFAYLVAFNDEVERHWVDTFVAGIRAGQLQHDLDPGLCYLFARDAIVGAIRWYRPEPRRPLTAIASDFADLLLVGIASS